MKRPHRSTLLIIFSAMVLCHPLNSLSQTNILLSGTSSDSADAKSSRHSFFTAAGYGSNMIYLGSTISQDLPYGYASLTYGFRDKLYASVSAVHLSDRYPFVAFIIGTANYNHVFNSWLDLSTGISYYNVAPSLADTLFANFLYGDLTLGFDWRILYSKISLGGLFSEETNAFLQISNSRYFQTPEFPGKKLFFSFDPYANLILGSLTTVETTTGTTVILSPPYRKGGKKGQNSSSTKYSTKFGVMEIDFGVPVALNSSRMTVEAEAGYVLPLYDDPEYPGSKGFVFLLSGYFRIF